AFGLFVVTATVMGQEAALGVLLLLAVPILFILAVLFKLGFRRNTENAFRKLYEERLPPGEIGPDELELTEDCLVEGTSTSERATPLQDVQGVASDGDRTFLSTGPAMACVIPHRSISEAELEAFVEAVRMRRAAAGGADKGNR